MIMTRSAGRSSITMQNRIKTDLQENRIIDITRFRPSDNSCGPVPVKWILKNNNATVSWIYHQVGLTGDFLCCLIVFLVV